MANLCSRAAFSSDLDINEGPKGLNCPASEARFFALRQEMAYGINRQLSGGPAGPGVRCSSSVVEHSLGKGEVESSILSCSTTLSL